MSAVHDPTSGRLALFADCLLAGLLTVLAALPLVTAYPAFTAGCATLGDRVRDDVPVTLRGYLRTGKTDEEIAEVLRRIWHQRADRYSEIRSSHTVSELPQLPKVEMSHIGG